MELDTVLLVISLYNIFSKLESKLHLDASIASFFEGVVLGKCGRVLSKAEPDHEQVCFLLGLFPHNVKCQVSKLFML